MNKKNKFYEDNNFKKREIIFSNYTLFYWFRVPEKNNTTINIFVHGFGSSSCFGEFDKDGGSITESLIQKNPKNGYLHFDFVGHGESIVEYSSQITPFEEVVNLQTILQIIEKEYGEVHYNIFCASHGALITALSFYNKINSINNIVAWYPCISYKDIFYKKCNNEIKYYIPGGNIIQPDKNGDIPIWGDFKIHTNFYNKIETLDKKILKFFYSIHSLLIFHGINDEIVPLFKILKFLIKRGKETTIHTIPNTGHCFDFNKQDIIKKILTKE